jgi:hypothetical protein
VLCRIIDPTKVVRAALQGAASVAGQLITTRSDGRRAAEQISNRLWYAKRWRHGLLMLSIGHNPRNEVIQAVALAAELGCPDEKRTGDLS